MAKILLKKVRLINWYGYTDAIIPLSDDLTLITGDNGTGKSVILDAIKYAYIGDTNFNKASEGDDNRTLKGYTRCLLNATENTWGRDAASYPVVYTHIALEFEDAGHSLFTLGVILTTSGENNPDSDWYEADAKGLEDLKFTREDSSGRMVLSPAEFQKENQVELLNKSSAMTTFSMRTGLRLSEEGVKDYGRKLRNLISYNPRMKLNDFIKTSVLVEHNADLKKLKAEKKSIDALNENLEKIERDLHAIDDVLSDYDAYARISFRLQIDRVKVDYKELVNAESEADATQKKLGASTADIELLEKQQDEREARIEVERNALNDLRIRLGRVDGAGELKSAEEELARLKEKEKELNRKKEELAEQEDKYETMLAEIKRENGTIGEKDEAVIHAFLNTDCMASEKQQAAIHLRKEVSSIHENLISRNADLRRLLQDSEEEIHELQEEISSYAKGLPDYRRIAKEKKLCDEINAYFEEHGISSRAHPAFEYVTGLKDARWQDAIECYLRNHRFSIIVDPQYFPIADAIHDKEEYRYTSLVNTPLLQKVSKDPYEDSVFQILEVQNPWAARFFAWFLGGIHAVAKEQVADYESAMSCEGKLSRSMEITWLDFRKTGSYYLGKEALQHNYELALRKKKDAEKERDHLEEEKAACSRRAGLYGDMLQDFETVDYDAPRRFLENAARIDEAEMKVRQLEQALKNNQEYIVFKEQEKRQAGLIADLEQKRKTAAHTLEDTRTENTRLSDHMAAVSQIIKTSREKVDAFEAEYLAETKQARREYDLFREGKTGGLDAPKPDTIRRREGELNNIRESMITHQGNYNHLVEPSARLSLGIDYEKEYRERRNHIAMDDLESVRARMADEKKNYETIFKNQFILQIYDQAEEALKSLRQINRELEHFPYEIKYRFRVSEIQDSSDYGKIMRFGKLLEQLSDEDNMRNVSLFSMESFPEEEYQKLTLEVEKIVEKITEDSTEESIRRFADYRNYLRYEIEYENQYGQTGDLSRQMGYNSGAEKQIPYTLILVAALSMVYDENPDSVRLAFIDEPFGKMSPSNVRIMTEFFHKQDFQTVFISASHLDDIGDACQTIIPVIRYGEADMRTGTIHFRNQEP